MEPIVFIDSLDNISIVNLNVNSLSDDLMTDADSIPDGGQHYLLSDHLDDDRQRFPFEDDSYRSHHRRTTSSLDKVRTWKKYKNKKHLSQLELDRKRDLANKQERRRMHRLNDALNRLRQAIPLELQHPPRKLSKIKTLQSAIKYIKRLQEMLQ